MSNTFKLRPTYFSRGGDIYLKGVWPPWLRACSNCTSKQKRVPTNHKRQNWPSEYTFTKN